MRLTSQGLYYTCYLILGRECTFGLDPKELKAHIPLKVTALLNCREDLEQYTAVYICNELIEEKEKDLNIHSSRP